MAGSNEVFPIANQLAESLCSENGLTAFRLLVQLHHLATQSNLLAPSDVAERVLDTQPACVGIWECQTRNGSRSFVRRKGANDWHLWADVQEIRPKGAKQRVVLVGESVARGFFYEPFLTPATVLASMLQFGAIQGDIDVVDLARSSLALGDMLKLTESAFTLEPDAIVILAGNNWHPFQSCTPDDFREMGKIVKKGGPWQEVKKFLERRLREQTHSLLVTLGRLRAANGVPIIMMIPEFNLLDWRSDSDEPAFLNGSELPVWLVTREAAIRAVAEENLAEAERLAQTLIDLDGGTSAAGFRVMAHARQASGPSVVRPLLEAVRDVAMWSGRRETPRCYGSIQDVLREEASRHDISIVDLPKRFEEYLSGNLPGRRLFGDYCHFTLEGMRVAMASAAEMLLQVLGKRRTSWRSLVNIDLKIPDKGIAQARFVAAVHNANWGNCTEVVKYHLEGAISHDPAIVSLMGLFLDFQIRTVPPILCGAFEEMARKESPFLVPFFFRSTRREKDINFGLIATMLEVLEPIEPTLVNRVRKLIVDEHATSRSRCNLLHTAYAGLYVDQSLDQDRHAHYRACRRVSTFVFICDGPEDTHVRIMSRTNGTGGDQIIIRVNGLIVHRFDAANSWKRVEFIVPRDVLVRGINALEIVWPETGWGYAKRTAGFLCALEAGLKPQSSPVFGEVHTLVASSIPASGAEEVTKVLQVAPAAAHPSCIGLPT